MVSEYALCLKLIIPWIINSLYCTGNKKILASTVCSPSTSIRLRPRRGALSVGTFLHLAVVASATAVLPVGLFIDEMSTQESSWGVACFATIAYCGVLPATLDCVLFAAVAVELEDQLSYLLSRRNQPRLLPALSTLALRISLQPCVPFDRTTLSVALELAELRLCLRHSCHLIDSPNFVCETAVLKSAAFIAASVRWEYPRENPKIRGCPEIHDK